MEARNEEAVLCRIPYDLSSRQLDLAIAQIKRLKQVVSVKRTGNTQLGILVDLGQLQGHTAQHSLALVQSRAQQELDTANTASRLVRSDLRLI